MHLVRHPQGLPELGYSPSADPPRGEVCIRGPALFAGYYGNEAMTKEVMGGCHTAVHACGLGGLTRVLVGVGGGACMLWGRL